MKRLNAPSHWMLDKLGGIFVSQQALSGCTCIWRSGSTSAAPVKEGSVSTAAAQDRWLQTSSMQQSAGSGARTLPAVIQHHTASVCCATVAAAVGRTSADATAVVAAQLPAVLVQSCPAWAVLSMHATSCMCICPAGPQALPWSPQAARVPASAAGAA